VLTSGAHRELCARGVPSWRALLVMYSITSMLSVALLVLTTGYAIGTILCGVRHWALSITARGHGMALKGLMFLFKSSSTVSIPHCVHYV